MGKTLRYGSKGNRVALEARIARNVTHRRTPQAWLKVQADEEVYARLDAPREQPIQYRLTAPGFGKRLPPR